MRYSGFREACGRGSKVLRCVRATASGGESVSFVSNKLPRHYNIGEAIYVSI